MASRIVESWRHHRDRRDRALDRKDHATLRDATQAMRDLEARMLPEERQAVGLVFTTQPQAAGA